jgi:hypothetical protein
MTGPQFRKALAELSLNPTSAAPFLGVSPATARRYAHEGARGPVDLLLRLLLTKRVTPADINAAWRHRSI